MKKKLTLVVTCVVLVAAMVIGGTLAYFTDTKDVTNTFTVGNVQIALIESKLHRQGNESSSDTSIPDPTQTASGMKYIKDGELAFTDEEIKADAENYQQYLAEKGENMVPGRKVAKCPYVINEGNTAAYIRIRVMIPSAADGEYVDVKDGGVITNQWCSTAVEWGGEFKGSVAGKPKVTENVERDGMTYTAYTFTRKQPLAAGAMTEWNVWNYIGLDETADSADIQKAIDAGAIKVADDGKLILNVLVEADAIQAEGFKNYTEAFAAFDGK